MRAARRAGTARASGVGSLAMQRTVVFIALVGFALAAAAAAEELEVYPAKGQTVEQQERDQFECQEWRRRTPVLTRWLLRKGSSMGHRPPPTKAERHAQPGSAPCAAPPRETPPQERQLPAVA